MMGAFRWRWLCCWAAFAAAIIALPANARAGCTHPWVKPTGAASTLADSAFLGLTDHPTGSEPIVPAPAKHSGPCAGGACSQPTGFPPSSTVRVSSRSELWGELSVQSPPCSPIAVGYSVEPGVDYPRPFPSPIERPPRLLAIR